MFTTHLADVGKAVWAVNFRMGKKGNYKISTLGYHNCLEAEDLLKLNVYGTLADFSTYT